MTLQEIKDSDALFLTPADVAPIIGCDPSKIREMARTNPTLLGFPVTVTGCRTKIWRIPFLRYIGEI